MFEATELGMRTRRGWVFRDVALTAPAGALVSVTGPAGSGRTMLLLTLAGRARPTAGRLRVGEATRRSAIRAQVAVARATGAVEPDPDLTVGDTRREARLLCADADVEHGERLAGFAADSATVVGDLTPDDRALLALARALAIRPAALVLDDADRDTTPAQRRRVWAALRDVAEHGVTVLASGTEPAEGSDGDLITIELEAPSCAR